MRAGADRHQQGGDIDLVESPGHSHVARAANEPRVMLGNLAYSVTGFPAGTRITATERMLLPVEAMFVCGRLVGRAVGGEELIVSTKGAADVMADNEGAAAVGGALGWLLTVAGAGVLAWAMLFVKRV